MILIVIIFLIYIITGNIKVKCEKVYNYEDKFKSLKTSCDESCDNTPKNLIRVIDDKTQFCLLNGSITYKDNKYPILTSMIYQFDGIPIRCLICTGYIRY